MSKRPVVYQRHLLRDTVDGDALRKRLPQTLLSSSVGDGLLVWKLMLSVYRCMQTIPKANSLKSATAAVSRVGLIVDELFCAAAGLHAFAREGNYLRTPFPVQTLTRPGKRTERDPRRDERKPEAARGDDPRVGCAADVRKRPQDLHGGELPADAERFNYTEASCDAFVIAQMSCKHIALYKDLPL